MKNLSIRNRARAEAGLINLRVCLALVLCSAGVLLAAVSLRPPQAQPETVKQDRYMPVPDGDRDNLNRMEEEWNNRLTYPTGIFNPAWVRAAAAQDAAIARSVPAGEHSLDLANSKSPLTLDPTNFTALGPKPLRMTGCSGCFNYQTTQGRVNDIAIDPVTTNVAYIGTVSGGVWKTTNCCSSATSWTAMTDDPLLATISIYSVTIDPNNHNTIYAGTGDQSYGSFAQGSQGILKSTDAGATWTLLGAEVFGPGLIQPAGQFPQYNAVGKVRVDPRNSNNVVAGTKNGLYVSNDGGANWTGPCATNGFDTMRQDITGLALDDVGGATRILASVGVRGFATNVQYNLGQNGANGIYKGTIPSSGCPADFAPISRNDNGWTGLNAASGAIYVNSTTGNQVGRIEMAVAPSDPNYIYAQLQSIRPNSNSGCGNAAGCQLGAYRSTDGGVTWTQIPGSTGASLINCTGGAGDYPQNWYDQAIAVDPNNPNRAFFSTFDIWFWENGNVIWNDTSCGYSGGNIVHVDQHALAFVPGSSSILLAGNDGGVHGTLNANLATAVTDPTWFHMLDGLNTIEFYSGDISGNFATSAAPQINGGAQDNGSASATFSGSPTGPVQWQMGKGGDGFYARIDPVGTGTSLRFWQGNNSGTLNRCINNCTASGATWSSFTRPWASDTQSFVLPYEIHKGDLNNPANDCGPAGATTGCGHLVVGTVRVWETITGTASTTGGITWYVNSPANLTKQALGNRSYINQLAIEPSMQSVVMVGTNDGNVQLGRGMGTGVANSATWVNLTDSNTLLPNRPILDVTFDPLTTTAPIGYAAVGGFNANTPTTPGHVFQVTCTTDCASFTWANKTGNLPDIPVDSIIANPKNPRQIFAGTDWGLYYTDDITVASPTWNRFENGMPHSMIWDMQIDRGNTTLSVWTRGRGAYVWPLPSAPVALTNVVSRKFHGAAGALDIDLTTAPGTTESRSGGPSGNYTLVFTFADNLTSVGSAVVTSGAGSVVASDIGTNPNQYTVSLTGVTNVQQTSVTLTNVQDTAGHMSPSIATTLPVLIGDVNSNRSVNSSDLGQAKSQSGNAANASNFRADLTADGNINSTDLSILKSFSGTSLP
ncbi:MAG: dockerin type I domain-containing protein [Chthoniobacterales bacterium]